MSKKFNIEEFSKAGQAYYELIKTELESEQNGKYVALDSETQTYWIGETASSALQKARRKMPNKLFYLVQIGSPATFSIQSLTFVS